MEHSIAQHSMPQHTASRASADVGSHLRKEQERSHIYGQPTASCLGAQLWLARAGGGAQPVVAYCQQQIKISIESVKQYSTSCAARRATTAAHVPCSNCNTIHTTCGTCCQTRLCTVLATAAMTADQLESDAASLHSQSQTRPNSCPTNQHRGQR
jgi:hypothetical protein